MKERKWINNCNKDDIAFKRKNINWSSYRSSIVENKKNDKNDMASLIADMLGIPRDKVEISSMPQKEKQGVVLDGQDGCVYEYIMDASGHHVRSSPCDQISFDSDVIGSYGHYQDKNIEDCDDDDEL